VQAPSSMFGALPHLKSTWACPVGVTAAWATAAAGVDHKSDPAQGTGALHYVTDGLLSLAAQ
jgi:hypothetical protein